MSRAYNFCAGPAALPEAVLQRAREEMLDYRGTGMSVMEMSHRDDVIVAMAEQAEKDLRDLMGISDDYAVLFLQGGASAQFAMVPMNLLGDAGRADYINTGQWSSKAIKEARRFGEINVAASSEDRNFTYARRRATGGSPTTPPTCITAPTKPSAGWSSISCQRWTSRWWRI